LVDLAGFVHHFQNFFDFAGAKAESGLLALGFCKNYRPSNSAEFAACLLGPPACAG
jgi:hypothetical protein